MEHLKGKPPQSWQELTELVAIAIGLPLVKTPSGYYVDSEGVTFDPVRDDADNRKLAIMQELSIKHSSAYTIASPLGFPELYCIEYNEANDDNACKAARLAVCHAVLKKVEHAR